MPAEINGNHVIARYDKAWVFLKGDDPYHACGEAILTPFFVFIRGHYGRTGAYSMIISQAIPREDIRSIEDRSVESCEVHDELDAEAETLKASDAKENKED